jgi:hypothetical protein
MVVCIIRTGIKINLRQAHLQLHPHRLRSEPRGVIEEQKVSTVDRNISKTSPDSGPKDIVYQVIDALL